jgi:hypothetical protein
MLIFPVATKFSTFISFIYFSVYYAIRVLSLLMGMNVQSCWSFEDLGK